MAFPVSIPLTRLVQLMKTGFTTRTDSIDRFVDNGEHITVIITDAPFTVPSQVLGANVLASKQVPGPGIIVAEWITRE